jgi:subtilisin-like proprotein convertase family protein
MLLFCILLQLLLISVVYSNDPGVENELSVQGPPTFGNSSTRTSSSLLVEFPIMQALGGGDTIAYEISKRSMLNSHWDVVSEDIGIGGKNTSEVQIINVRVDSNSMITGGTFELGISRKGLTPDDFEHKARTTPIPYNANAGQMKSALEMLTNVKIKEVKRCDEFGDVARVGSSEVGLGGFEQWIHGCPYGALGAYRWLVVFDIPVNGKPFLNGYGTQEGRHPNTGDPVYNMYSYRNDLIGAWTGSGPQVSITRVIRGMINPSLCFHGKCKYNVTSLESGVPYAFRTRAYLTKSGWSSYSKISSFIQTLELRVPSRMKPPSIEKTGAFNAIMSTKMPPFSQNVNIIKTQIRQVGGNQWTDGPIFDVRKYATNEGYIMGKQVIIEYKNLKPETKYEARCAAVNHVGSSSYSSASQQFKTTYDTELIYTPQTPIIEEWKTGSIASNHIDVVIRNNPSREISIAKTVYRVQYRSELETRWHSYPNKVIFYTRKQGVEIQKIVSRATGTRYIYNTTTNELLAVKETKCEGRFWLRMGVVASDSVSETMTSAIPFDASVDQLVSSIYDIQKIKRSNPRITAHRIDNEYNGYTWTVEIQGLGDIPRLQLQKHTLYAEDVITNTKIGECYEEAPADPVLSATLQNGNDVFADDEQTVRIGGLNPQLGYYFRVQVIDVDNHNEPGLVSNVTYARTTPDFDPETGEGVVPLDGVLPGDRKVESIEQVAKKGKGVGPAVAYGGTQSVPAKENDISYNVGAGIGGKSGQSGGNGFCSAVSYNPRKSQPTENFRFYYNNAEQTFVVPPATPLDGTIQIMTFKLWGGGGGGGKIADLDANANTELSQGGGGAFAQISVLVQPGDVFTILIGGGGEPMSGNRAGRGGFGYGGNGGNGIHGGGGGGGGLSMIRRGDEILLVAGGGGGAGSTDYCCAGGGAGGGVGVAESGLSSKEKTPWPLNDLLKDKATQVRRRFEYTSHVCPDDVSGAFCISEWDILPGSLPSEHSNLQWGEARNANFSVWATPGAGGNWTSGGNAGIASSFQVRTTGPALTVVYDGRAAVYSQGEGIEPRGGQGLYLRGGNGAGGKEGGGGGGGGFYGGGGGGSGIDAAGGGGGSSFFNSTSAQAVNEQILGSRVPAPKVTFLNEESVTFEWSLNWDGALWSLAQSFDIEISYGPDSEDFQRIAQVDVDIAKASAKRTSISSYTATGLLSETTYSFRVVPVFSRGRGAPSLPAIIKTLRPAINYWEPVTSRRLSMIASGRGYANPALQRPHLTPGVEVYSGRTSANPLRYSDPNTADVPVFPSSRRGSSLTLVDGMVYMFGGRSVGYSCAATYKDTLSRGTPESGREVYPCSTVTAEVSEMWSFDIHSYRWIYIDTVKMAASTPPPAREMHTASVIDGFVYVFGGKTRTFDKDPITKQPIFRHHADVIHGDFWKFKVPQVKQEIMTWPQPTEIANSPLNIPEDRRQFVTLDGSAVLGVNAINGDGLDARTGKCIDSVIVKVKIIHPCINQLRLSLMGPTPDTGSPNFHAPSSSHEILLYNQRKTNGTGCASGTHEFIFDEKSKHYTDECCTENYKGDYKPEGPLSEFIGSSMMNEWTLVLQDMKTDNLIGTLLSWEIQFIVSECVPVYEWTDISSTITSNPSRAPVARYGAKALAYKKSLFLFNGRDSIDQALSDLYRFDTDTSLWTKLTPINFNAALETASSVGSSFTLTAWGLIRFGGYYRKPTLTAEYGNYVNDNYILDPTTLRWKKIHVEKWPYADGTKMLKPRPRYLSSIAFIPAKSIHFKKEFNYRNLYDTAPSSTHANYVNSLADSILVFGGHDGATGGIFDGSTGGLLGDLWMLRLSNFSTSMTRQTQMQKMRQNCDWRGTSGAVSLGLRTCLDSVQGSNCDFRDMLMLPWCDNTNQTMSG